MSIYVQLSASCTVLFWSIIPCTGGSRPACRPREFPPVSIYCSTLSTCTCRGVLGYHRLYWRIKPTLLSKSISSCEWCIYLLLNTIVEQFLGITGGTGGSRPSWCQRAFPVFTAQHHCTGTVVEQFLGVIGGIGGSRPSRCPRAFLPVSIYCSVVFCSCPWATQVMLEDQAHLVHENLSCL